MTKRKTKGEISEVGSFSLSITSSEVKRVKESPEQQNCQPISNLEDLDGVIQEPPGWVEKVEVLQPRSSTVLLNSVPNCHSEENNFFLRNRVDKRTVPKTLVCHDYKGGYQLDRYLHNANEDILGNDYTFYNWAQIDIFVYFSHHFITIPPLCWINTAHKNGVKVLGTLITEFNPGSKICDQNIFKNTETMKSFAKSLAELTKIFGFDGWLLNIENDVKNIDVLKEFVPYLTHLIHEINSENLVIWYDSVTEKGTLNWQNALNELNRFFFDSCDGIFLNYSWSEECLMKTAEIDKFRNFDVFVGIDIFGRNMFGGGKFNTYKAAEIARHHNLSIAIFAPGWTHETLRVTEEFFEQFLNRDIAFWSSLSPYLYTHPINTYFSTDFYIGLDKKYYNLFSQQQQLSTFLHPNNSKLLEEYESIPKIKDTCSCLQVDIVNSRNVCLVSKQNMNDEKIEYIHHLFACDLKVNGNTVVYFLTKSADQQASLQITLITGTCNESFRKIVLLAEDTDKPLNNATLLEVNQTESPDILDNIKRRYSRKIEEDFLLRAYLFDIPSSYILEVGASIKNGAMIHLGGFGIENADGTFLINK